MRVNVSIATKPVDNVIVMEALSAYPFYKFICEVDSYTDAPALTIECGDNTYEAIVSGMDISVSSTGALLYNVGAVASFAPDMDTIHPRSFTDTVVDDIIAKYGFSLVGKTMRTQMSIMNMTRSDAEMMVLLANCADTPGYVRFDTKEILFHSQLMKQDPIEVHEGFRGTYSRPITVAYSTLDGDMAVLGGNASPDGALSFGRCTTAPAGIVKNIVSNYNELCRLYSRQQTFTSEQDIPLGSTVLSALSDSKCLIVAKESIYSQRGARFTYWVV